MSSFQGDTGCITKYDLLFSPQGILNLVGDQTQTNKKLRDKNYLMQLQKGKLVMKCHVNPGWNLGE